MIQITLPTDKVREFLKCAGSIETPKGDQVTILKYIKIEVVFGSCFLTKTNNRSFCKYVFDLPDADDCEILIEEKKLSLVCDTTIDTSITIFITESSLRFVSGTYEQSTNPGGYNTKEFPLIPEEASDTIRLTNDIIECLSISRSCLGDDDIRPMFKYSYIDNGVIYSSNRSTIYTKRINKVTPKISVSREEITSISNFPFVDYAISGNYNTYKYGNVIYGFIINVDAVGFDYNHFINQVDKSSYMVVKLKDILTFCSSTLSFADSSFTDSDFEVVGNVAKMIYQDKEKGENHKIETNIRIVGESFNFRFLPKSWKDFFGALKNDEVCIGNTTNFIGVWQENDDSYIGIVSKYS